MAKARTGTMRQRKPGVWQLIASIEKKQRLIDNLTKMDRLAQRIEERREPKYETFHGTEAQAQARLEALQAECEGADESPLKDTVAGLLADWMRSESYRWKDGTKVRYRGLVSQHIVPFMGAKAVVSLRARDIQHFYASLREQGRSEATIASVHSLLTPNPPMDRDGRREDSGRGEGVTGAMIRARIWVDGRLAGGLQALLGAPMAAYSGCGERDGGIGHGKRRSRTGLARVCGDVGLAGGSVADGRRQAGSGMARSRARARLNCSSQGQRRGRCRVNRRAERVIRPAKAKTRRLRVLVVTIC